jgi:hypothetical protein
MLSYGALATLFDVEGASQPISALHPPQPTGTWGLKGDAAPRSRLAGQHVRGQVRRNGCNGLIDRRECRLLRSLLGAKPTSGRAHETT